MIAPIGTAAGDARGGEFVFVLFVLLLGGWGEPEGREVMVTVPAMAWITDSASPFDDDEGSMRRGVWTALVWRGGGVVRGSVSLSLSASSSVVG
jgi:hypothetical protein